MRSWLLELVVTGVVTIAACNSFIIKENESSTASGYKNPNCGANSSLSGPEIDSILEVGTRVVRGQDWNWEDQDGGPGHEGRITRINNGEGWVEVKWDNGNIDSYRMGSGEKYDLQLACPVRPDETTVMSGSKVIEENGGTTTPSSETVTSGSNVTEENGSTTTPSSETVTSGSNVTAENGSTTTPSSETVTSGSNVTEENGSTSTPSSKSQTNTKCAINTPSGPQLGSFLKIGTRVVRGQDWNWGSQDGGPGKEGRITCTNGGDGWVHVEWDTGNQNAYRMGNNDKYDLQLACSETQTGKTVTSGSNVTEENGSTTTPSSKSLVDKNIQKGNEAFGKLVEIEMASVPISSRIQAMQDILEVFKKLT